MHINERAVLWGVAILLAVASIVLWVKVYENIRTRPVPVSVIHKQATKVVEWWI
jgi:hypothetical protein